MGICVCVFGCSESVWKEKYKLKALKFWVSKLWENWKGCMHKYVYWFSWGYVGCSENVCKEKYKLKALKLWVSKVGLVGKLKRKYVCVVFLRTCLDDQKIYERKYMLKALKLFGLEKK